MNGDDRRGGQLVGDVTLCISANHPLNKRQTDHHGYENLEVLNSFFKFVKATKLRPLLG